MNPELYLSYPSAFLIGLLGSTHCLGMCGGISASLSMALPVGRGFRFRQTVMLLAFNFGRIGSYVLIATLVALASTSAASQWASDSAISAQASMAPAGPKTVCVLPEPVWP